MDLDPEDLRRMGSRNVRLHVVQKQSFAALRTVSREVPRGPLAEATICACSFLRGSPGVQVSCGIYDKRPRSCREAIRPGDRDCRALRGAHLAAGLRVYRGHTPCRQGGALRAGLASPGQSPQASVRG